MVAIEVLRVAVNVAEAAAAAAAAVTAEAAAVVGGLKPPANRSGQHSSRC